MRQSPRRFGKPRSVWSLQLAAEAAFERGITPRRVSHEAIRLAIRRLGIGKRAKRWITSPDPAYARKKSPRPADPAGPEPARSGAGLSGRGLVEPLGSAVDARLVERTIPKHDPDPKALACHGLLRADTDEMLPRFVRGRPASQVAEDFLAWVRERLAAAGKRALLLVWDNAPRHVSRRARRWIKERNRRAKQSGGVRIVACFLPIKSPGLNPIEPKWVHGKRALVEPDRPLSAAELKPRVCDYYGCEHLEPLAQLAA